MSRNETPSWLRSQIAKNIPSYGSQSKRAKISVHWFGKYWTDFARDKSAALFDIYSLLRKRYIYIYVKSCHVQETMRTTNNNNWSNQPQKYQLCTCSTLLSTFAVVLHDYNDKNSTNLPVTRFTEEMYVFLFTFISLQLIFTLVAASISHFLTAAIKFSCFSSEEIGLRYFNSRSLAAKTRGVLEMQTFTPSYMKG